LPAKSALKLPFINAHAAEAEANIRPPNPERKQNFRAGFLRSASPVVEPCRRSTHIRATISFSLDWSSSPRTRAAQADTAPIVETVGAFRRCRRGARRRANGMTARLRASVIAIRDTGARMIGVSADVAHCPAPRAASQDRHAYSVSHRTRLLIPCSAASSSPRAVPHGRSLESTSAVWREPGIQTARSGQHGTSPSPVMSK
jgi:hypothetical protein